MPVYKVDKGVNFVANRLGIVLGSHVHLDNSNFPHFM